MEQTNLMKDKVSQNDLRKSEHLEQVKAGAFYDRTLLTFNLDGYLSAMYNKQLALY